MLPAQHRMRRSADFGATVRHGRRSVQSDIVIHSRRRPATVDIDSGAAAGTAQSPLVGLIIAKSVGSAVDRHRVARRLRHVTRGLLSELIPDERVVIRALPSSSRASSEQLARQVHAGLTAVHRAGSRSR